MGRSEYRVPSTECWFGTLLHGMPHVFERGAIPGKVLADVLDSGGQQAEVQRRLFAGDADGVDQCEVQLVCHRLEQRIRTPFLDAGGPGTTPVVVFWLDRPP